MMKFFFFNIILYHFYCAVIHARCKYVFQNQIKKVNSDSFPPPPPPPTFSDSCSRPVGADLHSRHGSLRNREHEVHAERSPHHRHHGRSQRGNGGGGRRGEPLHLWDEGGGRGGFGQEGVSRPLSHLYWKPPFVRMFESFFHFSVTMLCPTTNVSRSWRRPWTRSPEALSAPTSLSFLRTSSTCWCTTTGERPPSFQCWWVCEKQRCASASSDELLNFCTRFKVQGVCGLWRLHPLSGESWRSLQGWCFQITDYSTFWSGFYNERSLEKQIYDVRVWWQLQQCFNSSENRFFFCEQIK